MYCSDDPKNDPELKSDPLKTLFVARLSYEATEKDLEQEFSRFGPIEDVSAQSKPIEKQCTNAN